MGGNGLVWFKWVWECLRYRGIVSGIPVRQRITFSLDLGIRH